MIGDVSVPAQSLVSNLTMNVKVTGVRMLTFRLWLGTSLLRIAARVIGCGIDLNYSSEEAGL